VRMLFKKVCVPVVGRRMDSEVCGAALHKFAAY
jgi:hypothetical protein